MADGKWVTGLTADMRAAAAARRVLAVRAETVAAKLGPATDRSGEDIEHVHQLRVATRRAGAALRIFGGLLPRRPRTHAKAVLRALRRAAGAARDWDVFLHALDRSPALTEAEDDPAVVYLTGYALGHRAAAQDALRAVLTEHRDAVAEMANDLSKSIRRPKRSARRALGDLAAAELRDLFRVFADELAAGPATPDALHQLRITAKRVRYAMEVFADLYAPPFREVLYPAVERAQELLGAVQDGHVGVGRLETARGQFARTRPELVDGISPGVNAFESELRRKAGDAREKFREWVGDWERVTAAHPLAGLGVARASS